MLKGITKIQEKNIFLFGFTETNLNRMEFNKENIIFDFGYAGNSNILAVVSYIDWAETKKDIEKNYRIASNGVKELAEKYKKDKVLFFPISISTMEEIRTPLKMVQFNKIIFKSGDRQLFYSGRDTESMKRYLKEFWIKAEKQKLGVA